MGKISGKNRPHRYDPTLQGHKLTVRYVGTGFSGWQRQPKKRTVQECLEQAVQRLWGEPISLQGSGRTDTGVHGLGQVVSFNAKKLHTAEVVVRALNANLPEDVRVMTCRLVHPSFHARFQAIGKTYHYLILNQQVQDPFHLSNPLAHSPPAGCEKDAGGRPVPGGRSRFRLVHQQPRLRAGNHHSAYAAGEHREAGQSASVHFYGRWVSLSHGP